MDPCRNCCSLRDPVSDWRLLARCSNPVNAPGQKSSISASLILFCSQHPELPQRVSRIFQRHGELHLTERCCRLPARLASEEELQMCHRLWGGLQQKCPSWTLGGANWLQERRGWVDDFRSQTHITSLLYSLAYVETVKSTASMKPRELHRQGDQYNSIYICASSYECARLAAGSAFSAVQAVLSGKVSIKWSVGQGDQQKMGQSPFHGCWPFWGHENRIGNSCAPSKWINTLLISFKSIVHIFLTSILELV